MRETQRDPTCIGRFFKTLAAMSEQDLPAIKAYISQGLSPHDVDFPMYCLRVPAFMRNRPFAEIPVIGPLVYDRLEPHEAGPVAIFNQHYLVRHGRVEQVEMPYTRDELKIALHDRTQPYFPFERKQFRLACQAMRRITPSVLNFTSLRV